MLRLCLPLLLVALTAIGAAEPAPAIRLGVMANRGELTAKTMWTDFAAWVAGPAGRPVELVPMAIGKVKQAVDEKAIELLICNPGLAARIVAEKSFTPLATWKGKDGSTRMAGVILANPAAGIATIADLRGKKIMTAVDDSAGAWQCQAALLLGRGIDPAKDIARTVSKKQDDIVLAVKAGLFDAGFVRNGVLEDMIAKGKLTAADVRVVDAQPAEDGFVHARSTPFYPEWFLLARSDVDAATAAAVAAACLALPADHPALVKAEITGWVKPLDLGTSLDLLKALKQPPFDR